VSIFRFLLYAYLLLNSQFPRFFTGFTLRPTTGYFTFRAHSRNTRLP